MCEEERSKSQTIKDLQDKILEIMIFVDHLCRENGIVYYIMGGTALGAVRHGGFIPWDDDLDVFMTPENYGKFHSAFSKQNNDLFVLQEWHVVNGYLEYAKVRMNGTTFIESNFKDRKDFNHGIYVDIMILHKCPRPMISKKALYVLSKYVTLYALSQRNWRPKRRYQFMFLLLLKFLPNKLFSKLIYKRIYGYDSLKEFSEYCYWITTASFQKGLFEKEIFGDPSEAYFEGIHLYAPTFPVKYLAVRYGDYLRLPPVDQRKKAIHALIYDVEKGYESYISEGANE